MVLIPTLLQNRRKNSQYLSKDSDNPPPMKKIEFHRIWFWWLHKTRTKSSIHNDNFDENFQNYRKIECMKTNSRKRWSQPLRELSYIFAKIRTVFENLHHIWRELYMCQKFSGQCSQIRNYFWISVYSCGRIINLQYKFSSSLLSIFKRNEISFWLRVLSQSFRLG